MGNISDVDPNLQSGQDTGTNEISELRNALRAANERLTLYEGFDRLIEDQVRRAGETVREVVALRDAATHASVRNRLNADLEAIAADVRSLAVALESLGQRVDRLRTSVGHGEPATEPSPILPFEVAPAANPGAGPPSTLDLIVHQVPDTATAVSLQRFVSGVEAVNEVEVREFAEGLLRLRLTVTAPLDETAFATWEHAHRTQTLHRAPTLIELAMDSPIKH